MSRVNKNQKLYEELSISAEGDLSNSSLSSYAEKLKSINNEYKAIPNREDDIHEPTHARVVDEQQPKAELNEQEFVNSSASEDIDDILWNTFENTYLKEFIDEVKQYNVKKGYRRLSDTNANIMAELNSVGSSNKFDSSLNDSVSDMIEPEIITEETEIEETITIPTYIDIDKQLKKEDRSPSPVDENTIALEVQRMVDEIETFGASDFDSQQNLQSATLDENKNYTSPLPAVNSSEEFEESKEQMKELLETTQQLKLQVDDYKQNLEEMNSRVALTNRVISFLMYVLIVAILVVILLFVWWTLN